MPAEKEEVQTEGENIETPEIKTKTIEDVKKAIEEAQKAKECSEEAGGDTTESAETTKEKNGTSQEHEAEDVNQNAAESSELEGVWEDIDEVAAAEKQTFEEDLDIKADQWEDTEHKGDDEGTNLSDFDRQAQDDETGTKSDQRILDDDVEKDAQCESTKRALDEDADNEDTSPTKKTKNLEEFDESTGDSEKQNSDDS